MIFTTTTGRVVKAWLTEIEDGAREQAEHLADLPFTFRQPALMPDAHQGYGMPIGGVLATSGAIIPNAVGVDIGCGMVYCETDMMAETVAPDALKVALGEIRKAIPVGMTHHKYAVDLEGWNPAGVVTEGQAKAATFQAGTLGGGNHFIEIQRTSAGKIAVMIHSGSRNLGLRVANHYNTIAKNLNARWRSSVPPEWDLAFLPEDSNEGQAYLAEMNASVAFALLNRTLMMDRVCEILAENLGIAMPERVAYFTSPHNFVRKEHHFGHNVWVHRKGATLADEGRVCIIPGSQGTASYLGVGLGNPESFMSCSHGAGRRMGRKAAQRDLDLAAEQAKMDALGILHAVRAKNDLDEAPGAYKDIDEVMANQADLVQVTERLTPLAVVKG